MKELIAVLEQVEKNNIFNPQGLHTYIKGQYVWSIRNFVCMYVQNLVLLMLSKQKNKRLSNNGVDNSVISTFAYVGKFNQVRLWQRLGS